MSDNFQTLWDNFDFSQMTFHEHRNSNIFWGKMCFDFLSRVAVFVDLITFVSIYFYHRPPILHSQMMLHVHTEHSKYQLHKHNYMMTSSNGNIFRVAGPLCGEFTGHQWIPRTKASDAELWCFHDLIWAWMNGWVNNCEAGDLGRHRAHHDVIVMICFTNQDKKTLGRKWMVPVAQVVKHSAWFCILWVQAPLWDETFSTCNTAYFSRTSNRQSKTNTELTFQNNQIIIHPQSLLNYSCSSLKMTFHCCSIYNGRI